MRVPLPTIEQSASYVTERQSGGLRKVRCSLTGKGKSGGIRVVYYWDPPSETFYMLLPYAKNKQEDLTAQQLKALGRLAREEFR